jgi:hypothetical protein
LRAGRRRPARFTRSECIKAFADFGPAANRLRQQARADKDRLLRMRKVRNAYEQDRQTLLLRKRSLSPSCSWLSELAENHERK